MPGTDSISGIVDVDIKWKLSMAVSSNEVRNLNEPMITMMMITTGEDGDTFNRSLDLNLLKFRELLATLRQIQEQMENAKLV